MGFLEDYLGSTSQTAVRGSGLLAQATMPEPEKGAFMSFIDWLDRPGQAVRSALSGEFGRAGRHVLDFLGEVPDAFLPGDIIPQATKQRDFRAPSEFVGMDQDAPWYYRLPVDLAVGIATDPLSLLTLGGAGAARAVAKEGAKAAALGAKGVQAGTRVEDAVTLLSRNLSKKGKEALKQDDFVSDLAQFASKEKVLPTGRAVDEVDYDMLAKLVKGDPRFEQGGMRYLGKQISPVDPLSALAEGVKTTSRAGFEMLPIGAQAKLARASVGVRDRAKSALQTIKSGLGWSSPGPLRNALNKVVTVGGATSRAAREAVDRITADISQYESYAISSVFNNVLLDPRTGKPQRVLNPGGDDLIQMGSWDIHAREALDKLNELGYNIDTEKLMGKITDIQDLSRRWVDEAADIGAWSKAGVYMYGGEMIEAPVVNRRFEDSMAQLRQGRKRTEGMLGRRAGRKARLESALKEVGIAAEGDRALGVVLQRFDVDSELNDMIDDLEDLLGTVQHNERILANNIDRSRVIGNLDTRLVNKQKKVQAAHQRLADLNVRMNRLLAKDQLNALDRTMIQSGKVSERMDRLVDEANGIWSQIQEETAKLKPVMDNIPDAKKQARSMRGKIDRKKLRSAKLSGREMELLRAGKLRESRRKAMEDRLAVTDNDIAGLEATLQSIDDATFDNVGDWARQAGYVAAEDVRANPFYLQRTWLGTKRAPDDATEVLTGAPSALKERTLTSGEDIMEFLQGQEDLYLEPDAVKALRSRAAQQGRIVQRGKAAKEIFGEDSLITDPQIAQAVGKLLNDTKVDDPDLHNALVRMFNGLPPRGPFTEMLATANKAFKAAAVYGLLIPKVGSIVRNRVGGLWQGASTGTLTKQDFARAPLDIAEAFADGMHQAFGLNMPKSELSSKLTAVDNAFNAAGGNLSDVKRLLAEQGQDDLLLAVDNGVLDTFVSSEGMLKTLSRNAKESGKAKKWLSRFGDMINAPAAAFQGVESRMRLATYLDLMNRGYDPSTAAALVQDTYLNYAVSSSANRLMRDLVPFWQFTGQSIPQQAKFMRRRPAVGVGYAQLTGGGDEPVMPWIEEQPHVRLDDEGSYLTGLGLPVETLATIPTTGRDIERNVVGMAHPLLKTSYSMVTGRDPFFGTKAYQYDKLFNKSSEFGRMYNTLASTGLIQPVESVVSMMEQATDERKAPGMRAFNLLSGAKIATSDPHRALVAHLQRAIEDDPRISYYMQPYQRGDDPALADLLKAVREAKNRSKAKRDAKAEAAR
jgi:hypothetical protein